MVYTQAVKKFPLKPLVQLRAHAVDQQSQVLQERNRQISRAEEARAEAEHLERQHDAERRAVEAKERARLQRGEARVTDFRLLAEYEVGATVHAQRLQQQSQQIQQRLVRAERERDEAERALANARAEHRVVEIEELRFKHAQLRLREAREEEEALEVWSNRRTRC